MKRVAWIFLCVLLVVGLCGCNQDEDEVKRVPKTTAAPTTTTGVPSTTATTTTGALVITDAQGTVVTNPDGSLVTTYVTAQSTTIRPVTDSLGITVTEVDGTNKTEIVVPPHITVSTDAEGTTHTSHVTEHTITTTTTTTTTATTTSSTTASTTSTTKPTQQDVSVMVSLPAEGYTPDNRIKLGEVKLEGRTVIMTVKNISSIWETEDGKTYFEYTCYDKHNAKLHVGRIDLGYMMVKSEKVFRFDIPENTVKVALTDFKAEYWSIPV